MTIRSSVDGQRCEGAACRWCFLAMALHGNIWLAKVADGFIHLEEPDPDDPGVLHFAAVSDREAPGTAAPGAASEPPSATAPRADGGLRRSPLRRKTELARKPMRPPLKPIYEKQPRALRRSPWRRKPRRLTPEQRRVRKAVLERDGVCRLATHSRCFGRLEAHHLKKAGQGGPYTEENLVALCSAHNTWVEDNPHEAALLGFVIHPWEAS